MTKKTKEEYIPYADQIKHPKWQELRLEVLSASNFSCSRCFSKDKELHVHHPAYRKGVKIWDYEYHELYCLCSDCHKIAHVIDDAIKEAILALANIGDITNMTRVLGYLHGLNGLPRFDEEWGNIDDYKTGFVDANRQETDWVYKMFEAF